ncbi:MAG TPA: hypothetical protein VEC10_11945 [Steroidobacteraceae bacterium]|nr:hypothetical protein [Steroidobacteraceae bacterium]
MLEAEQHLFYGACSFGNESVAIRPQRLIVHWQSSVLKVSLLTDHLLRRWC